MSRLFHPFGRACAVAMTVTCAICAAPSDARGDEGMWPFDRVPREAIRKRYGVAIDDAWLEHLRLASVRFNNGGSGSFVSATGLVLTNHHVGADCVAKLGRSGRDYLATGFVAGPDGAEAKCPDLEVNQLLGIEDVTAKVQSARNGVAGEKEANTAVKAAMSRIERECTEQRKVRCDVVTLYAGARYDLYTYRKYTDVRLVFAPEQPIAFFGGDADNFTFPRFDLDMAIFRVYDGDKPLVPSQWLKWKNAGPSDGDTVFVSGHPGSTGRMLTVAQLHRLRDTLYPAFLAQVGRDHELLTAYAAEGTEPARQAKKGLFGAENGRKAVRGYLRGLLDKGLMKRKADDEAALRRAMANDRALAAAYGSVFDDVARAQTLYGELHPRVSVLEEATRSSLFGIARHLVRMAKEKTKPSDDRLREYRDSNLESLTHSLLSPAPIYGGVEAVYLRSWLERVERVLGAKSPLAKVILDGKTPAYRARELASGTQLSDVFARRALLERGQAGVDASTDPMIVVLRALDDEARAVRKRVEDEVEAPMRRSGERIAALTFAVRGADLAPDATFTLRLSYGVVRGYDEGGKHVPWATDFAGLLAHATGKEPYRLPERWLAHKGELEPRTRFNFVSTTDIIGGNSGSPVVDAKGELVGLIFDGNLSSLANRFIYADTTERAVSVTTSAMGEALRKVYAAESLAQELGAGP